MHDHQQHQNEHDHHDHHYFGQVKDPGCRALISLTPEQQERAETIHGFVQVLLVKHSNNHPHHDLDLDHNAMIMILIKNAFGRQAFRPKVFMLIGWLISYCVRVTQNLSPCRISVPVLLLRFSPEFSPMGLLPIIFFAQFHPCL